MTPVEIALPDLESGIGMPFRSSDGQYLKGGLRFLGDGLTSRIDRWTGRWPLAISAVAVCIS
jgi:hypothetical protein